MNDAVSVPLTGQTVTVLDTPALIVDLDVLEANIARIAKLCRDSGVNWRPHVKGNKTVEIVSWPPGPSGSHAPRLAKPR